MHANSSVNTSIKPGAGYKTTGSTIKIGKKVSMKSPQNERRDMRGR